MPSVLAGRRKNRSTTFSLFCGLGGEHLGKRMAFDELGIDANEWQFCAINHWDIALQTFAKSFRDTLAWNEDLTETPGRAVSPGRIELLWMSPSCMEYSRAKGGAPRTTINHYIAQATRLK